MDDNIHYFQGITLRNDPQPQFEKYNTVKYSGRAQADKIQMKDVMKYFSRTKIYENHLTKFHIIGFLTGNKFSAFSEKLSNAYGRAHVYQCVLINVTTPVDYIPWAWAMEDIDFNLRTNDLSKVNLEDGVIVKFHRFMVMKKWLDEGGVMPTNVDKYSVTDEIHKLLKEANAKKISFENCFKKVKSTLNDGHNFGEDKERADRIKRFLDVKCEPETSLQIMDNLLQDYKYPPVFL